MSPNATRASLLLEIRDKGNSLAWSEFVSIYLPLLHSYAMKAGLQDSDAADVAQDVLRQVVTHIQSFEYQPERGSFRGWLLTIARNLLRKRAAKKHNGTIGTGESAVAEMLSQQPARVESDAWETEYQQRLFQVAAENIKPEFRPATWAAFWKTAVENTEAVAVAGELGMSIGAIYIARSRVLARLREETKRLDVESS
jgi:RNA polymerase sigma factor (sigma-70 family)